MFYINAAPKIMKVIIALLHENGFVVRETKMAEYILVRNDPTDYIPDNLRTSVKIKEDDGEYIPFLKEAGRLRDILHPPKLQNGATVLITGGPYADFKGIVKSVHESDNSYSIELSIWGQIVQARIEAAQVKGTDSNLLI